MLKFAGVITSNKISTTPQRNIFQSNLEVLQIELAALIKILNK